MSSMPQTTACVLGHRGRSGEFEACRTLRLGEEAPPEGPSWRRVDALPSCAADLFTRTCQMGVWPTRRRCRSPRWQCHVLEGIGCQLASGISPDAFRYIVSIFKKEHSAF